MLVDVNVLTKGMAALGYATSGNEQAVGTSDYNLPFAVQSMKLDESPAQNEATSANADDSNAFVLAKSSSSSRTARFRPHVDDIAEATDEHDDEASRRSGDESDEDDKSDEDGTIKERSSEQQQPIRVSKSKVVTASSSTSAESPARQLDSTAEAIPRASTSSKSVLPRAYHDTIADDGDDSDLSNNDQPPSITAVSKASDAPVAKPRASSAASDSSSQGGIRRDSRESLDDSPPTAAKRHHVPPRAQHRSESSEPMESSSSHRLSARSGWPVMRPSDEELAELADEIDDEAPVRPTRKSSPSHAAATSSSSSRRLQRGSGLDSPSKGNVS